MDADENDLLPTAQCAELPQRCLDALLPAPDAVWVFVVPCRISGARIVEPQHRVSLGSQPLGKMPICPVRRDGFPADGIAK